MQASVGGGGSGAAARAAGSDLLLLRERPEKVCMERVLRESDGLGFCRSSLAGRRLNPTLQITFQYKERTRVRLLVVIFAAIPSDGIQGAALVQEVAGKGYKSSSMPALKKG